MTSVTDPTRGAQAPTVVDLIRHGEPVGGRRYRGQADDPLSEKGWQQMWTAVGNTAPWQQIISSPLRRCSEFAHALASRHGLIVREDERLMEVGFGVWEGRTADEIRREDPDALRRFYADPLQNRPKGAEPLDHFSSRVTAAWRKIVSEHPRRHVLVVCHAGVMRCVVAHLLQVPVTTMYRIQIDNAAIARVRFSDERPPSVVFAGSPYCL